MSLDWEPIEGTDKIGAVSESHKFRNYYISEFAWTYLTVTHGDGVDFGQDKDRIFNSVEAAKLAAELMEGES